MFTNSSKLLSLGFPDRMQFWIFPHFSEQFSITPPHTHHISPQMWSSSRINSQFFTSESGTHSLITSFWVSTKLGVGSRRVRHNPWPQRDEQESDAEQGDREKGQQIQLSWVTTAVTEVGEVLGPSNKRGLHS